MAYVLEVTDDYGEIKYINSANVTVYCPEYAARYDYKRTALTIAASLIKGKYYTDISVKQLSQELCLKAYKRNRVRSYMTLYPDDYK